MQFFHGTNLDFMSMRRFFFFVSILLTFSSIVLVTVVGLDYGIDFVGGSELAVKFDKSIHTDEIRKSVEKLPFSGVEIKSFGEDNQFLIRMKESGKASNVVMEKLIKDFPQYKIELLKTDSIGPKIGKELRDLGFLSVILAVIAMLIYIAFRFEFTFGLGAIVALVHDVVVTFGIMIVVHKLGLIDMEFNQGTIAAVLTVVGYSVNDTVIVFDRIRENKEKHKGMHFIKLVNLSINETLSRTINTVLTVVLVLVTLVLMAGPVLQGFSFIMLTGIVFGTYSSVYVASAFVVWYLKKVKKVEVEDNSNKTVPVKA